MEEIPASEFDGASFDAKRVVQHYRRLVPLPQLQRSLRAHHASARQELVELINEKYADFVSLSSRMQVIEGALKPLRAPLEESSELTRGMQVKLEDVQKRADGFQAELSAVQARKEALAAYIENANVLQRAKDALARWNGNPQEPEDASRAHMVHEAVARDLRRVRLGLGGGPHLPRNSQPPPPPRGGVGDLPEPPREGCSEDAAPECQALLREAGEFEEHFVGVAREQLRTLLLGVKRGWDAEASNGPARSDLLSVAQLSRALVVVGHGCVAEDLFSDCFLSHTLKCATAACSPGAEAGGHPGCAPAAPERSVLAVNLAPFFDALQRDVLSSGSPLPLLARRLTGAPQCAEVGGVAAADDEADACEVALLAVPGLRLVANSLAGPVLRHVGRVWERSVFMPAFPDIFAANFARAAAFVRDSSALMADDERQAFAAGGALADFQRRWKTQVYCSLRQKEADKAFKAVASKPLEPAIVATSRTQAAGCQFWLEASSELVRLAELALSDRWFLDPLFVKMAQLCLELVARYAQLVAEAAAAPPAAGEHPWAAAASPPAWTPGSSPVRLARVAADLVLVSRFLAAQSSETEVDSLDGQFHRLLVSRLPGASHAKAAPIVSRLLQEARDALGPARTAVDEALVRAVVAAATPQFAAIKGIPALYRMLNKPVPTKPSPYVESSVQPIAALASALRGSSEPVALSAWTARAVDIAGLEFSAQAAQLLESTGQQEALLRRRLGGAAAAQPRGEGAQVSDLDKIHIQLCVDAEAFAVAAADLGVAAGSAGLAKLAATVAPLQEAHKASRGAYQCSAAVAAA